MRSKSLANALEIVRSGYDRIAGRYTRDRERFENWNEIREFTSRLPRHARVLDVGCGTGVPVSQHIIENGFELVGIDLSPEMISAARKNVPGAIFTEMNMLELEFPAASFDGLISCYAVFHVPREQHRTLFHSFHRILRPGGPMLVSVGSTDWEGVEDYFGVDMFWSHYSPAKTEALITEAGFHMEFGRTLETGGEVHHWVLARKL